MMSGISRRKILRQVSLLTASSAFFAINPLRLALADEFAADQKVVEQWIDTWNNGHRAPKGALILGRFADPIYFVYDPVTWMPNKGQEQYPTVTVPKGFVTDLASIPRIFWSLLRPDGLYAYAAIVHDYLYWTQTTTKETADTILKFGMEDFKVDSASVTAIYEAVSLFGGSAWEENKRLKAAGENRILKIFPIDPTVTWEIYRKRPDVLQ